MPKVLVATTAFNNPATQKTPLKGSVSMTMRSQSDGSSSRGIKYSKVMAASRVSSNSGKIEPYAHQPTNRAAPARSYSHATSDSPSPRDSRAPRMQRIHRTAMHTARALCASVMRATFSRKIISPASSGSNKRPSRRICNTCNVATYPAERRRAHRESRGPATAQMFDIFADFRQ